MASSFEGGQPPSGEEPGEDPQEFPGHAPEEAPTDEAAHSGLPPLAAQLDAMLAGALMTEVEDEAVALETSSPMAEIEEEATPVSSTARAVEARNGGEEGARAVEARQ